MSIQSLSQDILTQIDEKKNNLSSQYNQELKDFEEELNQELKDFEESLSRKYLLEYSKKKNILLGSAHSKASLVILDAKQTLQEKTKSQVYEILENLDKEEKKDIYLKYYKAISNLIDVAIIECSIKEYSLLKDILPKTISLEKNSSIIGGFKAYSVDKKFSIDVEFSTIVEEIFQDYFHEEN